MLRWTKRRPRRKRPTERQRKELPRRKPPPTNSRRTTRPPPKRKPREPLRPKLPPLKLLLRLPPSERLHQPHRRKTTRSRRCHGAKTPHHRLSKKSQDPNSPRIRSRSIRSSCRRCPTARKQRRRRIISIRSSSCWYGGYA